MIKLKDIVVEVLNEGVKLSDVKKKWIEDKPGLTDVQINYYWDKINAYNQNSKEKINLLKTPFANVEKIVDAGSSKFSSSVKNIDGDYRDYAKNNGLVVYDKNNMMIVRADSKESCIILGKGEKWCISRRDASNMYYIYKYGLDNPTIYFSYDFDKVKEDVNGILVIMVNKDGKYNVADRNNAENSGNKKVTWDYISKLQPKLEGIKDVFVYKEISQDEKARYDMVKKIATFGLEKKIKAYKELDFDGKSLYIDVNHVLSSDLFWITPKELQEKYIKIGGLTFYEDMIKFPPNLRKLRNEVILAKLKRGPSYITHTDFMYLAYTDNYKLLNIYVKDRELLYDEFDFLVKNNNHDFLMSYLKGRLNSYYRFSSKEFKYLVNNNKDDIIIKYIDIIIDRKWHNLYFHDFNYLVDNNKDDIVLYYLNKKNILRYVEFDYLEKNNKNKIITSILIKNIKAGADLPDWGFYNLKNKDEHDIIMYYLNKKIKSEIPLRDYEEYYLKTREDK